MQFPKIPVEGPSCLTSFSSGKKTSLAVRLVTVTLGSAGTRGGAYNCPEKGA